MLDSASPSSPIRTRPRTTSSSRYTLPGSPAVSWIGPAPGFDRAAHDRTPSIPGHELSGIVVELGYGTTGLTIGQRVFGLSDWTRDGALAEYVAVEARNLAPLPADINHRVGDRRQHSVRVRCFEGVALADHVIVTSELFDFVCREAPLPADFHRRQLPVRRHAIHRRPVDAAHALHLSRSKQSTLIVVHSMHAMQLRA